MSFDEALEVAPAEVAPVDEGDPEAEARGRLAIPAPTIPLPTTSRSNGARRQLGARGVPRGHRCQSGFVQALPPRASATSTRAYGALGQVEPRGRDEPVGVVARISAP